jgi:hypothetical protein
MIGVTLNYKQEFGIEIRQEQEPENAICGGTWPNRGPSERLRTHP